MPKFNKEVEELETHFDKWMYVLKNLPRMQNLPPQLQERIFQKIFQVAEIAKMDKSEMVEYEESLKNYRDLFSVIDTAKKDEKREIAMKMLEDGMSVDIVSKYTGLSKKQIEEIQKK